MKIEQPIRQTLSGQIRNERIEKGNNADTQRPENAANARSDSDKVALSAKMERVQAYKDSISNQPDFRSERVQELKTRIDSGSYRVDSKDVAGKMLASLAR
jgi:flagellar biosynthesis anti-sigma factor FlgM